ncbi:MAG: thioredoxin family protein [Balneolaceae bacterium]
MKHCIKIISLAVLVTFFRAGISEAQITADVPYRIMELETALETAKEENKKVILDVYAEWCPYCRRMHNDVYPDEKVSTILEQYFILVHIDIESNENVKFIDRTITQSQLARALRSQSTPTTYFMSANGEVIGMQPGLLSADIFATLLSYIGSDAYKSQSFEEYSGQ